ncbi:uncharacterized protein BDR25DRAFT_232227 [Lindgomyces ingoldianus]|uniref:Uncharacterized protein n=1 Tax=Lindgomyces ingoldianus TaxID=673940 RepID=A0ACB6QP41_9PLEO|nr:uncharacterized protein BDR25DRAFT_232227 [Lindgomyces ingoldianus]KAF2468338.1 hypothetical protein BDR25DRAFT_232227 [Lindgomyces ingoldianus]
MRLWKEIRHIDVNTLQRHRRLRHPTRIVIRCNSTEKCGHAILTVDTASENNIISHHLFKSVLHEPIQSIDADSPHSPHNTIRSSEESVRGYVDLVWYLEDDSNIEYQSRFFVVSSQNPPYDAVLGRRDAERYGILKPRLRH